MHRLLVLAVLTEYAKAAGGVSVLTFNTPPALKANYPDGVSNSEAMFGTPRYGHSQEITGLLIYAGYAEDNDACEPFTDDEVAAWNLPDDGKSPFILLVDRGTCHFVLKVRHAQTVGARAAVIVDNRDEPGLPLMADDGTGGDISIPSILIHKDDGNAIKTYFAQAGSFVSATLGYNLPRPDGRVEWEFWTSSDDKSGESFKLQFDIATRALGNSTKLTPHYFFESTNFGCLGSTDARCTSSCINNGRYCADDPEGDITYGLTGKMVVEENLRQICLWQTYTDSDDDPQEWFDYVSDFIESCSSPISWGKDCSYSIIDKYPESFPQGSAAVDACVMNASLPDGTVPLIEKEIAAQYDSRVFYKPTVVINNVPYVGSLSCPSPITTSTCGVLSGICDGFAEGTEPIACTSTDCPLGQVRDPCGVCGGHGVVDACGDCYASADASGFKTKCVMGCDGVINSGLVIDPICHMCGISPDKCTQCLPMSDPARAGPDDLCPGEANTNSTGPGALNAADSVPGWLITLIVFAVIITAGVVVYFAMNARERRTRADIDDLLRQYLPMEGKATSGRVPNNEEISM